MDGGFCSYQPFDFQRGTGPYFEIFRSCFKCRLPIAIVLIALAFMERFTGRRIWVYRLSILFTAAVSVVWTMDQAALAIPGITEGMRHLPGYAPGLGWLLPAVIGGLLGRMIPGGNETGDGQG